MDANGRLLLFRTRSLPTSLTDMAGIAPDAMTRRRFHERVEDAAQSL